MRNRMLIFGAAGDLTGRYLLPALLELDRAGELPDGMRILGVGRQDWDDAQFRQHAADRLARHAPEAPVAARTGLLARLAWRQADATAVDQVRDLVSGEPAVVYLALPPAVYPGVVDALRQARPPAGTRLVVEKPFGTDQDSAQDLNRRIAGVFREDAVFRIDHFLGKQTVQNVLGLRFANRVFEPVWNQAHVSFVDIVWDETLGLEGRAGYYDHTGALRDMIQNHLLQLLSLVAMEPPSGLTERALRDRKVDVLRATRPARPDEISTVPSRRGRYTAGTAGGVWLPDYVAEEGVDPTRETETFAEVTLMIDNWRWAGVPFRLRTGKALATDRAEIALHLRPVPHLPFPGPARPNVLRLRMAPDQIGLAINLNGEGDPLSLEPAELDLDLAPAELPAYARLLLDILDGDPMLSIRDDEAEAAWRIVAPTLASWERGEVPLETYPAGSNIGTDTSEPS